MKNALLKKMALLMAGVMILSVTACGAEEKGTAKTSESSSAAESSEEVKESSVEPTPEPEKDYQDTEFRIAWWGSDARNNGTVEIIELFDQDHQNLKTDVEFAGYADYVTMLQAQAAGGTLPDVFQLDVTYLNQYVEAGLLMPLDDYVASGALDLSNVGESVVALGTVNGPNYAVAAGLGGGAYIYNPAILEEAGETLSETPTWDEFIEVCKNVYEKTGSKAMLDEDLERTVRTFGEDYVGADGKSVGISVDTLVTFWEAFYDGLENGYFLNTTETSMTSRGAGYRDEIIWISPATTNAIGGYLEESKVELKFAATPGTEKNPHPAFVKPTMFWCVASNCENPELAIEFINYYVNDSRVYDVLGTDRAVPISSEIRKGMYDSLDVAGRLQFEFMDYLTDGHSTPMPPLAPTGWNEAIVDIKEKTSLLLYHAMQPEEFEDAAAEAIKAANDVLGSVE